MLPVSAEQAGRKLEAILKSAGFSRRMLIHLKKRNGSIRLDGEPVFVIVTPREGQTISVDLSCLQTDSGIVPSPLPLDIVYEDEDLFVLNKPAGMPVHPSQGHYDDTLSNALAYYFQQLGEPFCCHAIGRLDKDTSGLVLFARHELSSCILSSAMRDRRIHREYRAVCTGLLDERGSVSAPIARAHDSTIERCISEHGETAVTHYERLAYQNGYSLAKVRLETGRTHQIRVHMKHIGHPLPGDFLYNPDYTVIDRQALHSYRLEFPHPMSGKRLCFEQDIPADMQNIISSCSAPRSSADP